MPASADNSTAAADMLWTETETGCREMAAGLDSVGTSNWRLTVYTADETRAVTAPLATAGSIDRTLGSARQIQFALKLIF